MRRSAAFASLPDSALHGGPRHAGRPLPLRRVRRAAAAADLGPGHRHPHRPGRRAAAGRHQRRHHPRPRAVRRLPRRRRGHRRPAGRRARRGDGLRVPGGRRLPARLVVLADRGHHPRPRAGHPRPRPAREDAVLARRRARAARWSSAGRSGAFLREVGSATPEAGLERGRGRPGWTSGARPTCRPTSPSRRRPPATCPTTARCWSSGSATSSATGGWSCTRRSARRSTPRGRWCSPPGCASGTASTSPAMHSDDGIVLRLPDTTGEPPEADLAVLDPDDVEREVPPRSAAPRCSPAGSASAPPGRCCSPAATRAGAPRCGSSGSGRRSCSRWPASSPRSRSRSRRPARCCRTCTTCPGWSS